MFGRTTRSGLSPSHVGLVVCVVGVAIVLGVVRMLRGDAVPTADVPAVTWEDTAENTNDAPESASHPEEQGDEGPLATDEVIVPTSKNLALPFTSQAPTGNWDALHEDACEEASVYMVTEYFAGVTTLPTATTDGVLQELVAYEEANGYGPSVTAAELARIVTDYFDGAYAVQVLDNPTVDSMKALINEGYPIIVPAAGRLLGNPFFTGEGPLYHMLVVRGYEDGRFITNDPGTRHGENYTYAEDVFMNAIHDWNNGDPLHGTPRVLVLRPVR